MTVRKIRRLGATLQISVNHPDGGSLSLPVSETDLGHREATSASLLKALLPVHQLLDLLDWMAMRPCKNLPFNPSDDPNEGRASEDETVAHHPAHVPASPPISHHLRRGQPSTASTD